MNTTTDTTLPAGFEALEPHVEMWAVDGAHNRLQRRLDSSEAQRRGFFEAAQPLADTAMALLDSKPLTELDAPERRLLDLMLSLAHVSLAVELQRDEEAIHADAARHLRITRASADDNPRIGVIACS